MKSRTFYLGLLGLFIAFQNASSAQGQDLFDRVIIRRTAYGVPHIKAENMQAAGFALGYVQLEDYGKGVVDGMVRARGEWTQHHDLPPQERSQSIDRDAASKLRYARAVETFPLLRKETQDILIGFAAGMNRYIEVHPSEFPAWLKPDFTGYDVHAGDIGGHNAGSVQSFMRRLLPQSGARR